jgi:DNA primase
MTEILNILNNIGYVQLTDTGTHWRCNPLYRQYRSQNALAIVKATGQWYDHSERTGGSLAKLIQLTLNLTSLEETKQYLGDLPTTVNIRESVELTEIKKFSKDTLLKLVHDNSYWQNRGISETTLKPFGGGVVNTKGRMTGRYVFPIFDERKDLIGFAGRLLQPSDKYPKWKLLGQKKNFIFPRENFPSIRQQNSVILVESIGDCLKMMECGIRNVLVSFGVSLSPQLVQCLLKLDVGEIIISLNNDEDGGFVGNQAAEEYREELLNYFDPNQIKIALPTGKDFGEMSCEEIFDWKSKYLDSVVTT